MGIFDRLGRMARAEVSELKRVLREAREASPGAIEDDEDECRRLIADAEAELAREHGDTLRDEIDEIESGAAAWSADGDVAAGADLWAQPAGGAPSHGGHAKPGRAHAFPREVREAYAVLELPLGSDRAAIEAAFRTLVQRYHPDRHAQSPHLLRAATELTIRIREARDRLLAWLEGA